MSPVLGGCLEATWRHASQVAYDRPVLVFGVLAAIGSFPRTLQLREPVV